MNGMCQTPSLLCISLDWNIHWTEIWVKVKYDMCLWNRSRSRIVAENERFVPSIITLYFTVLWDIGQGQGLLPRMRKICTKYHYFLFHCNVRYRSRSTSSIVAENERFAPSIITLYFTVMWDIGQGQGLLPRMRDMYQASLLYISL